MAYSLATFPRPANDNGIGIHLWTITSDPVGNHGMWLDRVVAMKMKWVTSLNTDLSSLRQIAQRGLYAVCRPMPAQIDKGYEPDDNNVVENMHAAGLPAYVQIFNEPTDNREWSTGVVPSNYRDIWATKWIAAARWIANRGGLPGIQTLDPSDYEYILNQILANDPGLIDVTWFSSHNYPFNHPPDYVHDQNSWVQPLFFDDVARKVLGHSLVTICCEGGWTVGDHPDANYPPTSVLTHAQFTVQAFDMFRTCVMPASRAPYGNALPDWWYAVTPFVLYAPYDFPANSWFGGLNNLSDTINGVTAIPTFTRCSQTPPPPSTCTPYQISPTLHDLIGANPNFYVQMRDWQTNPGNTRPFIWLDFRNFETGVLGAPDPGQLVPPEFDPVNFQNQTEPYPYSQHLLDIVGNVDVWFVYHMIDWQYDPSNASPCDWNAFKQHESALGVNAATLGDPPPEFGVQTSCGTPHFLYNECVACNKSRPVYMDDCGNYTTGPDQDDSACGAWCQAACTIQLGADKTNIRSGDTVTFAIPYIDPNCNCSIGSNCTGYIDIMDSSGYLVAKLPQGVATYTFHNTGSQPVTYQAHAHIDVTGGPSVDSNIVTITVSPVSPGLAITITADKTTVQVTTGLHRDPVFFNSLVSGGTAPYAYLWVASDFGPVGGGATLSYGFLKAGNWTMYCQVKDVMNGMTATSNTITITVLGVPLAPSNLTAQPLSETNIQLNWQPNSTDEDGYSIEMAAPGGQFSQVGTVGAGALGTIVSSLLPGTTYQFRVNAFNVAGSSGYSNTATATTLAPLYVDLSAQPMTVKVGDPVTFTAQASGGVPPYSYHWVFGDGSTDDTSVAQTTHAYQAEGTYSAYVSVTDASGASALSMPLMVSAQTTPPSGGGALPIVLGVGAIGGLLVLAAVVSGREKKQQRPAPTRIGVSSPR